MVKSALPNYIILLSVINATDENQRTSRRVFKMFEDQGKRKYKIVTQNIQSTWLGAFSLLGTDRMCLQSASRAQLQIWKPLWIVTNCHVWGLPRQASKRMMSFVDVPLGVAHCSCPCVCKTIGCSMYSSSHHTCYCVSWCNQIQQRYRSLYMVTIWTHSNAFDVKLRDKIWAECQKQRWNWIIIQSK